MLRSRSSLEEGSYFEGKFLTLTPSTKDALPGMSSSSADDAVVAKAEALMGGRGGTLNRAIPCGRLPSLGLYQKCQ